jgi:hypothetical protein
MCQTHTLPATNGTIYIQHGNCIIFHGNVALRVANEIENDQGMKLKIQMEMLMQMNINI